MDCCVILMVYAELSLRGDCHGTRTQQSAGGVRAESTGPCMAMCGDAGIVSFEMFGSAIFRVD
jgi:hypothetical protein